MQCSNCGSRPATIHVTQVENNQSKTVHLCDECAAERGLPTESAAQAAATPLVDFLAQMAKTGAGSSGSGSSAPRGPCPGCGITLAEFKRKERLGCADCYTHFAGALRGLLRRLHGATQHVGKGPTPSAPVRSLAPIAALPAPAVAEDEDALRAKLGRAIDAEDYEQAAQLRDQLRALRAAK